MSDDEINEYIELHVMGSNKPDPITYREAERRDKEANGGHASCFRIMDGEWKIDLDWCDVDKNKLKDAPAHWRPIRNYTEDDEAVFYLVEKMAERGYKFGLELHGHWAAWFYTANIKYEADDESRARAIALAAIASSNVSL